MAYKSSYTGPQIDQAVGNALIKDTSTLSNDVNHIPASSVVKSALNTVDESIAIRVSGAKTTYASGAAIGQYVIVSDSTITGITDGLYKAAKAIPYNTVIDSTYLTAVSGGGLNDIKSALSNAFAFKDFSTTLSLNAYRYENGYFDIAVSDYCPIALIAYGTDEDHCFTYQVSLSPTQKRAYYRVKNTDSLTHTPTFIVRVLYYKDGGIAEIN